MNSGYRSIEERAEKYKAITPARIKEVANLIFRPENLTLTVKGNKKKISVDRLEKIIKEL
jgi:predicted Zn-dependent peptidase